MAKQASAMAQATSISAGYSEATKRLVAQQNAQMTASTAAVRAEAAGRAAAQLGFAILAQKKITSEELVKAETLLN